MDNDTQTLTNMHFYTLMGGLNRFDFHHGKPWQWLNVMNGGHFLDVSWSPLKMIFKKNLVLVQTFTGDITTQYWNIFTTKALLQLFHHALHEPTCLRSFNPPSFASLCESHSNCMEWRFQVNDRWPHRKLFEADAFVVSSVKKELNQWSDM